MATIKFYGTAENRDFLAAGIIQGELNLQLLGQGLTPLNTNITQLSNQYGYVYGLTVDSDFGLTETMNRVGYALNAVFFSFDNHVDLPSVTPTTTGGGGTYTVVGGDTLSRIAVKTGTTVANLIALNSATYPSLRTNPNLINIGWVLRTNGTVTTPVNNGGNLDAVQAAINAGIANLVRAGNAANNQNTNLPNNTNVNLPNPPNPPNPPKSNLLADISKQLGVAPYVIGVASFAIVLIVLSNKGR